MRDLEFEKAAAERIKAAEPKHYTGDCEAAWGNCDPKNMKFWGSPTDTPHRCSGPRHHLYKLHVCETCKFIGHRIMPSAYSKAGEQLRAATMRNAKRLKR